MVRDISTFKHLVEMHLFNVSGNSALSADTQSLTIDEYALWEKQVVYDIHCFETWKRKTVQAKHSAAFKIQELNAGCVAR